MALEKSLLAVSQFFAADGTNQGVVTVLDASGFYTKQIVSITSNTLPNVATFQVNRVNSPTQIIVGLPGADLTKPADVSMYHLADVSIIKAAEQPKTRLTPGDIIQAVYEKDPAVAIRSKLVDTFGRDWSVANPLPVLANVTVTVPPVSVALDAFTKVPADNAIAVGTENGTQTGVKHALKVGSDGKLETKDTAADASLASIDSKLNTLGQKASVGSVPVVIASDQPAIPVTGSITVTVALDAFTKVPADNAIAVGTEDGTQTGVKHALKIGSDGKAEVKDTAADASLASLDTKITTTPNGVKVDGSAVVQPISATALPLPAGASTSANQTTGNASLASIDSKLNTLGQKASVGSVPVVIASDQLPVPVSGTVGTSIDAFTKVPADNAIAVGTEDGTQTGVKHALKIGSDGKAEVKDTAADASLASIDTKIVTTPNGIKVDGSAVVQPVSATALPLPAGAATSANQVTQIAELTAINTVQTDGTQKTQVTTSALPTGASTAANQATEIASLASIDSKLNTLGQKASVGSVPVVIASDQSPVPISATALPLPTGAATAANQTTEIASLANIDGKLIDLHTTPIKTIQVFTKPWDAITAAYPTTTQEVYQSRVGGVGGTVQQTATINYTDATKNFLQDVSVI